MTTQRVSFGTTDRHTVGLTNHPSDLNARRERRDKALALLMESGTTVAFIAQECEVSRQTVYKWRRELQGSGGLGLNVNMRAGRASKLSYEQRDQLLHDLHQVQMERGQPRILNSREYVRRHILEKFNIDLSLNSITRLLKSMGINMKVVRKRQAETATVD